MRTVLLMLVAVKMLTATSIALPCDEQQPSATAMQSMTVAELEVAGDACRAQKNYEQAITYFTEALRKDKKHAKLYNKRGLAELSSSQFAAARADFTKATKYNRNYPEAWNDLGVVSYIDRNYPAAVKYFNKAIALDEVRPNFHVNLGLTYFAQDQMDLAMSAQITDRDQRAKQDFMMARVYARLGQIDNCLVCLEKAKDNGYSGLTDVYKEDDFSSVRKDARLASIVPPPASPK
jgi:tetratricopeptide (TPR) repeat protein